MSIHVEMIICPICETSAWAAPNLPCVYVFASGEQLAMRRGHGWCEECHRIRLLEALPSFDALNQEEVALTKLARSKLGGLDHFEQQYLEDIGLYRRLLHQRQSPCRCLACGSTVVQPWLFNENRQATHSPHGGCPGMCQVIEDPDGMRIALIEDADAYSIEGDRLGRLSGQLDSNHKDAPSA
ncbi:hypothetical protein [Hydrogenophaga intermedia]|uniref:hypothetical protein n=1 Tax=Hydrogenophaga intermedia TaxID=65786 RepID=UPI00204311B4|nr:hypothetical protein [Hydrogenophaga intermedia]MCM3566295.1 hypothetical protein [Hydrogenophaga intermedia]